MRPEGNPRSPQLGPVLRYILGGDRKQAPREGESTTLDSRWWASSSRLVTSKQFTICSDLPCSGGSVSELPCMESDHTEECALTRPKSPKSTHSATESTELLRGKGRSKTSLLPVEPAGVPFRQLQVQACLCEMSR